jgi:hypothetical protein
MPGTGCARHSSSVLPEWLVETPRGMADMLQPQQSLSFSNEEIGNSGIGGAIQGRAAEPAITMTKSRSRDSLYSTRPYCLAAAVLKCLAFFKHVLMTPWYTISSRAAFPFADTCVYVATSAYESTTMQGERVATASQQ